MRWPAKGVKVQKHLNIGSRETYIPALQDGSIDLIPEYTGVLTQYFNKDAKATDAEGVYAELQAALPATLTVLDKSAAEDKDAVVVTKETADKYKLKSIADLQPVSQGPHPRRSAGVEDPPHGRPRPEEGLQPGLQDLPPARRRWPPVGQRAEERPGPGGQPLHDRPLDRLRTASSCSRTPRASSPRRTSCR